MKTLQYSEGYGVNYYPLKWKKDGDFYSAPIQWTDSHLENPYYCYWVNIEKDNGKYIVYAEDHNTEDFTGDAKDATFKTLKEAKAFAQDFALDYICCEIANEEEVEEEPEEEVKQQYTCAETSVNSDVPAYLITQCYQMLGKTNLDWGGGKFDIATEFLAQYGIENAIYDPYNRADEHNQFVLSKRYQTATCCNVLNVIKEKAVRQQTILNCLNYIETTFFISVYWKSGKKEGVTSKGYQMHKKPDFYINELKEILPSNCTISKIKGGFIKIEKH